jgi:Tfp pilus assembly protein PilV
MLMMNLYRRRQRGLGLIDGLVALAVLAFGMLAMTRFQSRMVSQTTEAQARLDATRHADELLNIALVDPITGLTQTSNGPCYAVPVAAGCLKPGAQAAAVAWAAAAASAVRQGANVAATSVWDAANSRLTATVTWTGKAVQEGVAAETHQVSVTTDVR